MLIVIENYSNEEGLFLDNVVTCDVTWMPFFEPDSKQESAVWEHPDSPSPVKARLSKSLRKVTSLMFCDSKGSIVKYMVPVKTTVNGEYYSQALRVLLRIPRSLVWS